MKTLQEQTRLTLLAMMAKRKLSHGGVAKLGGLHKSGVTRILTGERQVSLGALQGFAVALKVSASTILKAAERLD